MDLYKIVIVGGGFTGTALAAALARPGRSITVLEARTGPDPRFRGELLHPPGVQALASLGLLDAIRKRGGENINGFAVLPASDQETLQLPYDPAPQGQGPGFAIEHQTMLDAMREEVSHRTGVTYHYGERVCEVLRNQEERVIGVRTVRGTTYLGDLVLIAEGRNSKLRSALGLEGASELLSYSAALLAEGFELPVPHHGHVALGAPGPVLAYPIGGAIRFCIDVPADTERGRAAISQRLRNEYAPVLHPKLARALHAALDRDTLEVCASQQVRTQSCSAKGAALVGDAGGCSHPLTAAGMTSCLHDVQTLARALNAHPNDIDRALQTYERDRYRYVRARELLTERLYDVFLAKDPGLRALRDGMLAYWAATARARRASMALLAGQNTDLRAFAREFATVFSYATREAFRQSGMEKPLQERARAVARMTNTTYTTLRRASITAMQEFFR